MKAKKLIITLVLVFTMVLGLSSFSMAVDGDASRPKMYSISPDPISYTFDIADYK